MKRLLLLLFLTLGLTIRADELVKNVQGELKELGFYYGEITGLNSPETVAAVKRYQIRHGFEVTGTLTKETLQALGIGGGNATPPSTPPNRPVEANRTPSTPSKTDPPIHLRRNESVQESDRNFLRQETARSTDPSAVEPPAPLTPPASPGTEGYADFFAQTPFETAPAEVQFSTLRKAQSLLSRSGYYRDLIDGIPGPATEEAILAFQDRRHLTMTGRLDMETLSALALLPGRAHGPPMKPFRVPPGSRLPSRALRGVWIN